MVSPPLIAAEIEKNRLVQGTFRVAGRDIPFKQKGNRVWTTIGSMKRTFAAPNRQQLRLQIEGAFEELRTVRKPINGKRRVTQTTDPTSAWQNLDNDLRRRLREEEVARTRTGTLETAMYGIDKQIGDRINKSQRQAIKDYLWSLGGTDNVAFNHVDLALKRASKGDYDGMALAARAKLGKTQYSGTKLNRLVPSKSLTLIPESLGERLKPRGDLIDFAAKQEGISREPYVKRGQQAERKRRDSPGSLEHSMRVVDQQLKLNPQQRQYVKDYLNTVGGGKVKDAIELVKRGNFAMLRSVGNPQRTVDKLHRTVRIDDWYLALRNKQKLVVTRDKEGQMSTSGVTKQIAKELGVPEEWLAKNAKYAIQFYKVTDPGEYVKGAGEKLDPRTQAIADAVPDDGLGMYLRAVPAAFELFPHLLQDEVGQMYGRKRGEAMSDPDIQNHWGTKLGTAGFNAIKYVVNAPVAIGSDLLSVSQRMREVGFSQTLDEIGKGMIEANNPFAKDIDPVERGVRSINVLSTLHGAYKAGVKGGAQVALMKKYKLTPKQAGMVMEAAQAARKHQNVLKGALGARVEDFKDGFKPRQAIRDAGEVASGAKKEGILENLKAPSARQRIEPLLQKTDDLKKLFRGLQGKGGAGTSRRRRMQAGMANVPIVPAAIAALEWTSKGTINFAQALDRLEVPVHLRADVEAAARSIISKGTQHGIQKYAPEEDLRKTLDDEAVHVKFWDTSKLGLLFDENTGASGILEGGVDGVDAFGHLLMGKRPGKALLKKMDHKEGSVVIAANSKMNNFASHGPAAVRSQLKVIEGHVSPEKFTALLRGALPKTGPIRARMERALTGRYQDLDQFINAVRGLPSAARQEISFQVFRRSGGMLPDVNAVLDLLTDPRSKSAKVGDILGIYRVDPNMPVSGESMSSLYDLGVPVKGGGRMPEGISVYDLFPHLKDRPWLIGQPNRMRHSLGRGVRHRTSTEAWEAMMEQAKRKGLR